MPRVNTVNKARKAQGTCGRCGAEINVGDGYRWIKFRHGGKRIRCLASECRFRASDLTQSKMSGVYSAQENAEDSIGDCESIADLKALAEETAESVREVAQEYQDSADAIHEHFDTSDTADECEEKAQELEGWADEIENALDEFGDEFEPTQVDDPECPECGGPMTEREGDDGTWDCNDAECGKRGITFENDRDDEGRTEDEYLDAAREALESVISECPV